MSQMQRAGQDRSLSDDVYRRLKDYILSDVIRPPDRLQIGQLSQHFGVSITPIREALIRLAAEHIIDVKPGRGFFYREFAPGDQIKIHELLFSILKSCIVSRGKEPFMLNPDLIWHSQSRAQRAFSAPEAQSAAIARERLYEQLIQNLDNIHFTTLVGNLCERTRISRLLWLEQRAEVSVDRAELNELITLFGAGENRAGLTLLQERFGAKNRHMHALAKTRQGKIFETFPLLRPGSAQDKL